MGIIDIPKDKYEKYLTFATLFDGVGYLGFTVFVYGLKIGYVWHDAGPILEFPPTKMNGYLNMILVTYAVCGVFLLRVAKDGVKKHPLLLSMNAWALQFAHNIAMCANMLVMPFEGNPSYVLYGVPANFWPFGDVPFLFLLWAINIYLMKKVFGSYCP